MLYKIDHAISLEIICPARTYVLECARKRASVYRGSVPAAANDVFRKRTGMAELSMPTRDLIRTRDSMAVLPLVLGGTYHSPHHRSLGGTHHSPHRRSLGGTE